MKFNLKNRPKAKYYYYAVVLSPTEEWFRGFEKELRELSESEGICDVTAVTLIEEILGE